MLQQRVEERVHVVVGILDFRAVQPAELDLILHRELAVQQKVQRTECEKQPDSCLLYTSRCV